MVISRNDHLQSQKGVCVHYPGARSWHLFQYQIILEPEVSYHSLHHHKVVYLCVGCCEMAL